MNLKSPLPIFLVFFGFFFLQNETKAQAPSFNANTQVIPYTGAFKYGVNAGYLGPNWNDSTVAYLANKVGAGTYRLGLYDWFLQLYTVNVNKVYYKYYQDKTNLRDNAIFLNGPSPSHTDSNIYNYPAATFSPCVPAPSLSFKNIYLPIWNADGSVDSLNTFAEYVYQVVQNYGSNLKFYEVWNEPDANSGYGGSNTVGQPGNWYENAPAPQDMYNLRCPIYYYIRMCRIAYEVVHKYSPNAYVTTGGIGYSQFLDALLRYTDNPVDGSVTDAFPNTCGAYVDIISFHDYPLYNVHHWDGALGRQVNFRYSDACVADYVRAANSMKMELAKFGYNGTKYPAKDLICTETNIISTKIVGDTTLTGNPDYQRNYMMKALVYSQKIGVRQLYVYAIADNQTDPSNATDANSWMGLYNDVSNVHPGQETFTEEGIGFRTMSYLLTGFTYDSVATKNLALNDSLDGAAFTNGSIYRYVLWAKTTKDLSEYALGHYTFPASLKFNSLKVYNWASGISGLAYSFNTSNTIQLSGTPVIIEGSQISIFPPVANAGTNQKVVMPLSTSAKLNGSASKALSGTLVKFLWTKIAGGAGDSILNPNDSSTLVKYSKIGNYQYQLKVWDSNGNTDSSSVNITVLDSTIKKANAVSGTIFKIYPNPALTNATIYYQNSLTGIANFYIYDLAGRLFYKNSYMKTSDLLSSPLYVGNLGPGYYMAVMVMGSSTSSFVLINLP